MFRALGSDNFPPFGQFRFTLPPVENKPDDLAEVHLFTGVNGTGKTRLLSVLAATLGNPAAIQRRLKGIAGNVSFTVSDGTPRRPGASTDPTMSVGENGSSWSNSKPFSVWGNTVPAFAYNGLAYVCDAEISVMAGIPKPDRAQCLSFSRPEKYSKSLLQAISNLKVQAAMDTMNSGTVGDAPTRSTVIIRALEGALSRITGRSFLFQVTTYPQPSLRVKWANAELPFDLLPDGLRSIIGWMVDAVVMMDAWLQGQGSPLDTEAVFLLDEIESHLHPAWQRKILPAFQRLFPKAQIFVATHSPFVIASLNYGWIHRLTMEPDGTVKILEPQAASAGDSYITVVEDIMGVREQFDPESEQLLEAFRQARARAYAGDATAKTDAHRLAEQIGTRSMELNYMMGRELAQMDRQLAQGVGQ